MPRSPFSKFADWQLRHSRWVLGALSVLTVAAALQLPRLRFDFRPEALLEFSAEENTFAAAFKERFGLNEALLLIVLEASEGGSVSDARGLTLLYRLTELLDASETCEEVISLTTVPRRDAMSGLAALALGRPPPLLTTLPVEAVDVARVRSRVRGSRMLPGQLISEDGSVAMVVGALKSQYRDLTLLDGPLGDLQATVAELLEAEATADASDRGNKIHFAGLPFVRAETVRSLKREQLTFWPLTAAIYLSLLYLLYRDLRLAIAPLAAVGLACLWGISLLPIADSEVNVVNNIVPSLILVIGVCNAIHMLHAFVEARHSGLGSEDAARHMLDELGLPVFLATLTTAIGFASLSVARNGTLRDLGWQAASGILLSYVALVTFLPIVVARCGGGASRRGQTVVLGSAFRTALDAVVYKVMQRPRLALCVSLGVLGLALVSGSRVPIDARVIDTFPPTHPIVESNRLVEEKLGGILPLDLQLLSRDSEAFLRPDNLRAIFALQRSLAQQPGVLDVRSVVDLIAEVHGAKEDEDVEAILTARGVAFASQILRRFQPEALALFLSEDASEARVAARLGDDGMRASIATLDWIDERATGWSASFDTAVTVRPTGQAFMAARGLDHFLLDLIFSLLAAGGVIFLVLVAVFRSLRIGLLSLLPTILPLALTLGLIPLYGYELNTSTVVVFTLSIGMAVDNTIHILTAFRRARQEGSDLEGAIRQTFRRAGAAVVAANLLLMLGFAILFASDFEPVFRVAALTTTTIGSAMVVSILVLPELLLIWGRPIGRRGV